MRFGLVVLSVALATTSCATPPRSMATSIEVVGDYQDVALCFYGRVQNVAPWHLFRSDDGSVLIVRLGTIGKDPSRIEFAPSEITSTIVKFYIPHPDSYVDQLLACEHRD